MKEKDAYGEIGRRSARTVWWLFFLSSIGCLIAGGGLDYAIDVGAISIFVPVFSVLSLLLITLGSVVLTSAVGTFLLEETGLLEVIKHQIADIMVNAGFINLLEKKELIKLKKNINEKLHTAEIAKDEHSLLNTVERAIEPLLEKYYFKKCELEIQCEYKENYIEKQVSRTLLVNSSRYEEVELNIGDFFSVAFIDSMDKDVQGAVLTEFRINRKDYLELVELKPVEEPYSNTYRIKHILYTQSEDVLDNLVLRGEPIEIRITVKTKTNIEDKMIVHKIPVACKEYSARFNYDGKKYIVNGSPFGFMDAHIDGKYIMETISNSAIKISFNDWILPGDGVAFTINERN